MNNILDDKINELLQGEKFPWGEVADLLEALRLRKSNESAEESQSFSSVVKDIAKAQSLQVSTLWRYRSARDFYISHTKKFNDKYPSFRMVADKLNPENLEILKRISTVAPERITNNLFEKLLQKQISRGELRKTWKIYREELGGETMRGNFETSDLSNYQSRINDSSKLKADSLDRLFKIFPYWVGEKDIKKFRFFTKDLAQPSTDSNKIYLDALLITTNEKDTAFFHGIIFLQHPSDPPQNIPKSLDSFWVLTDHSKTFNLDISSPYGVIILRGDFITVLQEAPRMEPDTDLALWLAKRTIARNLSTLQF